MYPHWGCWNQIFDLTWLDKTSLLQHLIPAYKDWHFFYARKQRKGKQIRSQDVPVTFSSLALQKNSTLTCCSDAKFRKASWDTRSLTKSEILLSAATSSNVREQLGRWNRKMIEPERTFLKSSWCLAKMSRILSLAERSFFSKYCSSMSLNLRMISPVSQPTEDAVVGGTLSKWATFGSEQKTTVYKVLHRTYRPPLAQKKSCKWM